MKSAIERIALILCLVVTFLFITTAAGIISTEKQVARHIGLPVYVGPVPEHIRAELIKQLPMGTRMADVNSFLIRHGVGTEADSLCQAQADSLICTLGLHPSFWKIIHEFYTLSFDFDQDQRLQDIRVECRYDAAWADRP